MTSFNMIVCMKPKNLKSYTINYYPPLEKDIVYSLANMDQP